MRYYFHVRHQDTQENPLRPEEVGFFVPQPPKDWVDPRADMNRVLHRCDVYVNPRGLIYLTDYNAGLYILEAAALS